MAEIWLSGYVGYELTAQSVSQMIKDLRGEDLTINISTLGGSVYEGVEIYNVLNQYPGRKIVKMGSIVASIGTYIAAVGDHVIAQDLTSYMMHEVSSWVEGGAEDIRAEAERVEKLNTLYADRLSKISGKTVEEIRSLMKATSWFYGQEIVDAGFADELIETGSAEERGLAVASAKEQYKRAVAAFTSRENPGVAGEKTKTGSEPVKQENREMDKTEMLAQAKNLYENGKLTIREFAEIVGGTNHLITDEHREALKIVNQLKGQGIEDIPAHVQGLNDRVANLVKAERSVALTNEFGAQAETNLVRAYAEERVPATALGEDLAAAIEEVKNSAIAKQLAGQMADPHSAVNRIDHTEAPRDTEGPAVVDKY